MLSKSSHPAAWPDSGKSPIRDKTSKHSRHLEAGRTALLFKDLKIALTMLETMAALPLPLNMLQAVSPQKFRVKGQKLPSMLSHQGTGHFISGGGGQVCPQHLAIQVTAGCHTRHSEMLHTKAGTHPSPPTTAIHPATPCRRAGGGVLLETLPLHLPARLGGPSQCHSG